MYTAAVFPHAQLLFPIHTATVFPTCEAALPTIYCCCFPTCKAAFPVFTIHIQLLCIAAFAPHIHLLKVLLLFPHMYSCFCSTNTAAVSPYVRLLIPHVYSCYFFLFCVSAFTLSIVWCGIVYSIRRKKIRTTFTQM